MRTTRKKLIFGFRALGLVLVLMISGCTKDDDNNNNNNLSDQNDVDGNVYITITIGTQTWFKENLKTTKLNDGTVIPLTTENAAWNSLNSPGYCWYANDVNNKSSYGALYNWHAVNTGKLCPGGWHVASDNDWKKLEMQLGMSQSVADQDGFRGTNEGGKLKETGTAHWNSPNDGATNSSSFTALPGGCRYANGSWGVKGLQGFWWTSTEFGPWDSWLRHLVGNGTDISRTTFPKNSGLSVRCVKD